MQSYERLSALDAQFLYWDSPETPMNMGNVCTFEGKAFFDRRGRFKLDEVRQAIDARLHLVPRYRKKLMLLPGGVAHPVLVDDPDFDIANHVRLVDAAAPGGDKQLKEVFSRVHEGTLDRSRPLWEICFVQGLSDGRVGMIQKIHHAPYDGQSTVDVLERLLDKSADYKPATKPPFRPIQPPGNLRVLADNVVHQAKMAWSNAISGPYAPLLKPSRLLDLAKAVGSLGRLAGAPDTSLNRLARGENIDKAKVRVFIPVSLRSDAQRDGEGGNQISGFVAPLPVAEPDALARLRTIQATTAKYKKGKQPLGIHLIAQWVEFLPAALLKGGAPHVIQRRLWQNLTVTNVQGPKAPLYLLGARMLELNPMVPLGCQLSLNVAVESYVDDLRIGLSADADLLPDLDLAKRGIEESLRELLGRTPEEDAPVSRSRVSASTPGPKPKRTGAGGASRQAGLGAAAAKTAPKRAASARP